MLARLTKHLPLSGSDAHEDGRLARLVAPQLDIGINFSVASDEINEFRADKVASDVAEWSNYDDVDSADALGLQSAIEPTGQS